MLAAEQTPAVRVAAAQAIVKLGDDTKLKVLVNDINDPNLLSDMFALGAIQDTVVTKRFSHASLLMPLHGQTHISTDCRLVI